MFVPDRLSEYITDPCFRGLSASNQQRIVTMLWAWSMPRHQHMYNTKAASLHSSWLQKLWGNLETMRKVLADKYFDVIVGSNVNRYTHAYTPYKFLAEGLIDFLLDDKPSALRDSKGRAQERPRQVFRSRAAAEGGKPGKHSVWSPLMCSPSVPINVAALERFCTQTNDLRHQIAALWLRKLALMQAPPGAIPVSYEQVSTGRVFDVHWHLQCTPREVLSAALDGCWDYDIENAHYSIAYQWAKRCGIEAGAIKHYLDHKREVRQALSHDCGIALHDIKESLIALLYGAVLHSDPRYSSIADLVGHGPAERLKQHPIATALAKDVQQIRAPIVASMPKHAGRIGNAAGVYVTPQSQSKSLCHALQGVEVCALQAVVRAYGPEIVLLMHDGWVSTVPLDREDLEHRIAAATGFELKVEATKLPKYRPWGEPMGNSLGDVKAHLLRQFKDPMGVVKGRRLYQSPQWALPANAKGQRMPKRKPQDAP